MQHIAFQSEKKSSERPEVPYLTVLVDALVEAIDTDRADAVDRVQSALDPFGASTLFAAELRLNGRSSEQVWTFLDDDCPEVA